MPAEISLLIGSLGAIKDVAMALVNERDRHKAAAIQIDLSEKVIQGQAQLSEVLGAIIEKDRLVHALSERVRKLEAQQAERERYDLAKVGVDGQFFAYRLRAQAELAQRKDEPIHLLCQPCFDAGKKSVLTVCKVWGADTYRCPLCAHEFTP